MILPRVYPILDTDLLSRRGVSELTAAEALLEAGARLLQLRHKAFFSRRAFESASRIAASARAAGVQLIVNDRADIALLLQAGLHLGQDDLPPAQARKLVTSGIIGLSTHNAAQLASGDREPVEYLAIGPIFSTTSKENPDPTLGLSELARLRALTQKPLVAIGGITRETAASVWQTGADSVAVIGDLLPSECLKPAIRARMEEWIKLAAAVDGPHGVPLST